MSAFTFLHAADLHLGSPLAGLAGRDQDLAERFVAAGREAFSALVTHAVEAGVAFVVCAGDVFDREWADLSIGLFFARELARLDRAGIPFLWIRGNHDAESIVRRNVTLPPGTLDFPHAKAGTHRLERWQVAVHGRSFPDRTVPDGFVASYPAPVPGWFNLGLLHTSCEGHAAHDTYAPCTTAELAARGYDYWALGHVHDYAELRRDPPIVYPGNLQGRSVRECGPRGAVAVDVRDGRVEAIRRIVLDRARFVHLELEAGDHGSEAALVDAVGRELAPHVAEAADRPVAFRVTLAGETALHDALLGDPDQLRAELQAAAHRLHEDVWLERLRVRTRRPDRPALPEGDAVLLDPASLLAALDRDPGLREDARRIVAEIAAKLPGGAGDGELDDLDALLAEAEATVMARLSGRGC